MKGEGTTGCFEYQNEGRKEGRKEGAEGNFFVFFYVNSKI
jgi:hypothetical protein